MLCGYRFNHKAPSVGSLPSSLSEAFFYVLFLGKMNGPPYSLPLSPNHDHFASVKGPCSDEEIEDKT